VARPKKRCVLSSISQNPCSYSDGFSEDIPWKSCKCKFSSRVVCVIFRHQLHLEKQGPGWLVARLKHFSEGSASCKLWSSCTLVNITEDFEKNVLPSVSANFLQNSNDLWSEISWNRTTHKVVHIQLVIYSVVLSVLDPRKCEYLKD